MQSFLPTVFARRTIGRAQVARRTSWAQVGADVGHLRGRCCQGTRLHVTAGEPGRLGNVPGALTLSSRGLGEGMAGCRTRSRAPPAPAQCCTTSAWSSNRRPLSCPRGDAALHPCLPECQSPQHTLALPWSQLLEKKNKFVGNDFTNSVSSASCSQLSLPFQRMALPACIDAQKAAHGHLAEVYDKIQTAASRCEDLLARALFARPARARP